MTEETRTGSSRTPFLAALAVVVVIVGAVVIGQLVRGDDEGSADSSPPATGSSASATGDASARPERLLVPAVAEAWGTQTVADCAAYQPGEGPEVVYVAQVSYECVSKVPEDASAIFSATDAETIGGVSWEKASEPWVQVQGHQVMKKIEGDEFNLTSRVIQGIWVDAPREYAVFVGPESPDALAALAAP
ncbi:hypothetical protein [Nocardioides sp. W7]|uniref:hypothetical protein n=1 Tax=Nocardioides sp. W7 TaxID=2931390 RepID=UPI001FD18A16|nr:hypothetical protein [Nocardioides sp. W7]